MTDIARTREALAPEPHLAIRTQVCGCGATFEQKAFKTPMLLMPWGWTPARCLACDMALQTEQARDREERKAQVAGDLRRRALKDLAVPPLYAGVALASFEEHGSEEERAQLRKIKELACQYLLQWPLIPEAQELLLFQGTYGSGKGHVAWSIARAIAVTHAARVRVLKLAAVIRDLREAWRDPAAASEDVRLTRYRELDLLVIDEVSRHAFYGKEVKQHLYDIIDDRIEQHRPTILTTNEDHEGIAEILGPALMSRLNGAGGVLRFPAVDWRSRPQTSANKAGA